MERLTGRTVFITGAASGIGLGMARAFARERAKLALTDVDAAGLAAAAEELSAVTAVETFAMDVRDRDAFAHAADEAEARLGPVAVLCNNAGVGGDQPVTSMTYDVWDWVLGVDLGGVVNGVQTLLPRMLDRGGPAHVVNTASAAGLAVDSGVQVMYHTAKYAVVGMTEALQRRLAPYGIGVSVLCPGLVATNIAANSRAAMPACEAAPGTNLFEVLEKALAEYGLSPDVVGEMAVDGVRANRLYIHTDRTVEETLQARTAALLEALPPGTERDRALRAARQQLLAAATGREAS